MASGFLDFVSNIGDFIPGGEKAIPAWLAALLNRNSAPSVTAQSVLPYFANIANSANNFANTQAQFYQQNYLPAAINFNNRAQGVGQFNDLNEASSRGAAAAQQAHTAARANASRSMAGVNPNSGPAMARMGAIDAAYMRDLPFAMNQARTQREMYGNTLRAQALSAMNAQPNYGSALAASSGMLNAAALADAAHRQRVGDTTKALMDFGGSAKGVTGLIGSAAGAAGKGFDALRNFFAERNYNNSVPYNPVDMGEQIIGGWTTDPSLEDLDWGGIF